MLSSPHPFREEKLPECRKSAVAVKSVGILIATQDELKPLRSLLQLDQTGPGQFFVGKIGHLRVQVALSGCGPERAAASADLLCRYGQPDLLMSAGVSGGLWHEACCGDVALASSVETPDQPRLICPFALSLPIVSHPMLTLPTVVVTRAEKEEVRQAYPECWGIDMESYSLAAAAQRAGLPWLVLRAISDPWNKDLPLDFNQTLNADGQPHIPSIVAQLAFQPQKIQPMLRFAREVFRARTRLYSELRLILEELSR